MYVYAPGADWLDTRERTYVQLDAWQTAHHVGLPTLNGYSGQWPPGWLGLQAPGGWAYLLAVDAWIEQHGLSGVCAYSPATRTWLPHQQAVAEPERLDPDRGW